MSDSNLKPPPLGWTYEIPKYKQIVMIASITPSRLFSSPLRCIALGDGLYINADKTLGCPVDEIETAVLVHCMGADWLRARWHIYMNAGPTRHGHALYAPASPVPPPIPDEWLTPMYRKRK